MPCEPYKVNPVLARAMDRIFILHADHEQNASTSTVRLAGSTGANPYACIAAGIASLWGPAHGGANEAVLKMLRGDRLDGPHPRVHQARQGQERPVPADGLRPPRLQELRPARRGAARSAHEVLDELGKADDPLLPIAMELEKIALEDDYFVERKLFPNVDFYSGIILQAMGFPTSMFTALFAVARTVGWVAQWNEMVEDPEQKIGRPRQLYTGHGRRQYVPIEQRR